MEKLYKTRWYFMFWTVTLKLRHAALLLFVVRAALAHACIVIRLANKRINHSLPYHWFNTWLSSLTNLTILLRNATSEQSTLNQCNNINFFLFGKKLLHFLVFVFTLRFRIILLFFRIQFVNNLFYLLSVVQKPFFVFFFNRAFISQQQARCRQIKYNSVQYRKMLQY